MKKIILIMVLVLVVCLSIVGCGVENSSNVEPKTTTQETEPEIDFNEILEKCKDTYDSDEMDFGHFTVSLDGDSMSINCKKDSWSGWDSEELAAVACMNSELGFGEALNTKMSNTRALDGVQTDENDSVKVTWTYHPDDGLNIIYEKK